MQESDFVIRRCRRRERSLMHSVYVSSPESGVRWAGPAYAATTEILCAHWIAFADLDRDRTWIVVQNEENGAAFLISSESSACGAMSVVASTRKSRTVKFGALRIALYM